jgi:hypothetical protein
MLSGLQCSEAEAAAALKVSLKTFKEMLRIDKRAREAWEQGRELGRVDLRRKQFALAGRYPQMAIFLGKVVLGQKDVQAVEMSGPAGGPIKTLELGNLTAEDRKNFRKILEAARPKKE